MSTAETARKIDTDLLSSWYANDMPGRAKLVIEWGRNQNRTFPITPEELATAMKSMTYWNQGPSNYLDMLNALSLYALGRQMSPCKLVSAGQKEDRERVEPASSDLDRDADAAGMSRQWNKAGKC